VTATQADDRIRIEVADSGVGIDPAFLPHVFDRFRQADSGTTRIYGGLGLGLAIVKDMVHLHGGAVEAHSQGIGLGATFIVTLQAMATLEGRRRRTREGHRRRLEGCSS
jgi:signal transduction histidine kinase